MFIIATVVFVGCVIGLVWTAVALSSGRNKVVSRQLPKGYTRPRANVLLWLVGLITIAVALLLVVSGALDVADAGGHPNAFKPKGADALADAASKFVWGVVILTNGAYIVRGARRRGARDRLGRVVIIIGYVLLGVALSQGIHSAVGLWAADLPEAQDDVMIRTMALFLVWGVPAALLVYVGTRMADERIILTANVEANL